MGAKNYNNICSFHILFINLQQKTKRMKPNTTTYRRGKGTHNHVSFFCVGSNSRGCVNSMVLSIDDEKSRVKVSLDKMSYLNTGWDGLDAQPVSEEVISNVLHLLAVSENHDWHNWTLEPNINGTVTLRSRSHSSAISIGSDSFSYYIRNGRNITGKDNVPFVANAILEVMRSPNL